MLKQGLPFIILLLAISLLSCEQDYIYTGPEDLPAIPYQPKAYVLEMPKGVPKLTMPEDNPLTEEGISLGFKLFHDPILSKDSTMSCASCHRSTLAMTDGKAFSKGIRGIEGKRSAMSLVNVAFYKEGLFWDGRVKTLEAQALLPVEDSLELHHSWDQVVEKLKNQSEYPPYFRRAFGIQAVEEIDKFLVVKAIAQYERTLISADSKFDRVERGEERFSKDELIGYNIFFDASDSLPDGECGHCHNAPLMTTNEYLNNGINLANTTEDFPDFGRGAITGRPFDNGKFRVPSLRNIALTAPYMHDGRFESLEAVIEHYNSGGHYSPTVSPLIQVLNLDETQKRQLIAFLNTLTDSKFTDTKQQNSELAY